MRRTKSKITLYQFILMIYGIQVGIGVLSLPRELAEKSGTSSWISIIIGGFASTILSIVYIKLREKSPTENFVAFFSNYLGKLLGSIVAFILSLYFVFAGYVVLIRTMLYIQAYILQESIVVVIIILFLVPTYQLVTGGVQLIAKYIEAIFPITVFCQLMLLFTLKEPNINFILPIIKEGWMPIIKTVPITTTSFLGIELILIFYPYLISKEKAIKGVIIANGMTIFTYLFVTIICFVIYSPYEIIKIYEPVIDILSIIEFQFLERLDFILFSLFLMVISKTWVTYIWAGMTGISEVFMINRYPLIIFILCLCIIVSSLVYMPTFKQSGFELQIVANTGLIILVGIPILLLLGRIIKNSLNRVKTN